MTLPLGIFHSRKRQRQRASPGAFSISSSPPPAAPRESSTFSSSCVSPETSPTLQKARGGRWNEQSASTSSAKASKVLGTELNVTETRLQMDTHGIDLSSLGGSAHPQQQQQQQYYDAHDGLFRDQDSPDQLANGNNRQHNHHDQRQDAHAGLLQNAQDPACDEYALPSLGTRQNQHHQQNQQNQHHQHQQHQHRHFPPSPPPYVASNYLGPPNDRGKSSRMRKPHCSLWHSSWNMYLFLLLGIAFAVGHHMFYHSLDGKLAEDQVRMLRYGTILAFAAKASLGGAVIAAYQQRIWTTVRSRVLSIAALDSMFAATENLLSLVNWEFVTRAKAAAALALFVWLSPLVVILTANTLLVQPETTALNTSCPNVRSLNFAMEDANDWRKPTRIDGLYETPLSFWNTTKPQDEDPPGGWFDYYTGPSPNFQQTATLGAFFQEVVSRRNASVEVCSRGWNCTFEIDFTAPGYKCQELASGAGSKPKNLTQPSGEIRPPFGTDLLLPEGPYAYYAFTSGGEYSTVQMKDVEIGGIPKTEPPYPEHLGAFRTEPVIWIGHVVTGERAGGADTTPDFIPKLFACEHYETQYTAVFNYTDAAQTAYVKKRRFLAPVVNTTYLPDLDADDGTADNVTATPKSNYVLPSDVARYRRTASYHSLGFMLRKFLNGTVETSAALVNPVTNTEAIQTKLLDPRNNYFPHGDLMAMVQAFYEDLILSLFSVPQFAPVVWAARPGEMTGQVVRADDDADYAYPCRRSRMANVYSYHARDLWIVYAIAILLAACGVAAGALAVRENGGVLRNTRFSSVVAATRGPALEKVNWEGPDRDRGDVPRDVKRLKLGYGVMNQNMVGADARYSGVVGSPTWTPNEVKCGFGLEGDVNQNKREGSLFHR
ncbi:hypothetical protein Cob_v011964 [Colletotrichum orbiculare MAFF 240422]|uniref:Formylmethionine deformylase-like protein n=1 Tax=Colletotrichum orbiculare (strain 104-T / ATCC 96160 / CBS 514.97 / LARS 414 / MAFF 240422) TaxID=1213857 RepID=N4VB85_COLOR|nr:hypothetical protein Cob_v011964 [Colletotrichum orbiculare MAFF 240422]